MKYILFIFFILSSVFVKAQTTRDSVWAPKFAAYQGNKYQLNFFVNHAYPVQVTQSGYHYYPARCKVYLMYGPALVFIGEVDAKWPNGELAEVKAQSYDLSKFVIKALGK